MRVSGTYHLKHDIANHNPAHEKEITKSVTHRVYVVF
jgi:hypothetical protein